METPRTDARDKYSLLPSIPPSTTSHGSDIQGLSHPPDPSLTQPSVGSKRTRHSLLAPSELASELASASTSPPVSSPSMPVQSVQGVVGSSPTVPPKPRRAWNRRSVSWSGAEDARLVKLVEEETSGPPSLTAFKTWSRVAAQLTNRTGKQCRERYLNQLKPGIRRDPWTAEEERILHEMHAQIGNKWVSIAALLPGRTDNCVKNHWNSMLRKQKRREAALLVAHKDLNAKLGSQANGGLAKMTTHVGIQQVADVDYSMQTGGYTTPSVQTGYATPSGLSSAFDRTLSSGAPSPFIVSSPITPQRDSKLQIATLMATGPKENDNSWRIVGGDSPGFGGGGVNMGKATHGLHYGSSYGDKQVVANMSGVPAMNRKYAQNETGPPATGEVVHYVKGTDGAGGDVKVSEAVAVAVAVAVDPSGKTLNNSGGNVKMCYEQNELKNPLDALAMAASSVPPSPLTPESRYSTASGSRSPSPKRLNTSVDESERLMSATSETKDCCGVCTKVFDKSLAEDGEAKAKTDGMIGRKIETKGEMKSVLSLIAPGADLDKDSVVVEHGGKRHAGNEKA